MLENEEEVFNAVSHPVRRRILKTMFEYNGITFSEIKEWGISTGSIYHHLKALDPYIAQDDQRRYVLNDIGVDLCNWMLGENRGKVKVKEVNALPAHPLLDKIDQYQIVMWVVLPVLTAIGLYLASDAGIFVLGPYMFFGSEHGTVTLLLLNLAASAGIFIGFSTISTIFAKNPLKLSKVFTSNLILFYLLALLPIWIEISVLYLTATTITDTTWYVLTILNQLVFLFVLSASSMKVFTTDIKGSVISPLLISQLLSIIYPSLI